MIFSLTHILNKIFFFVSRAPDKPPSDSKEVQHGSVVSQDKIIKSELIDHEEIKVEIDANKKKTKIEHKDDVKVVGTKPIVISLFGKKSDVSAEKNLSSEAENNDNFETSENTFDQLLDDEETSPWNHVCEHCAQVFENDKCLQDHSIICNKNKTTPSIKVQNIPKLEKCDSSETSKIQPHVKDSNQSAEGISNVKKQLTTDLTSKAELVDSKDSKLKELQALDCDVCDYKAFSSQNLITHKKKKIQNPLLCPKCPFKSCSERGLNNHQKTFHGEVEVGLVNKKQTDVKETEIDNGNSSEVMF